MIRSGSTAEMSIGLDLDYSKFFWIWIRFGLQNSSQFRIWAGVGFGQWKRNVAFLLWKGCIFQFFWTSFGLELYIRKTFWTVFGLKLSLEESGPDLDGRMWESTHICSTVLVTRLWLHLSKSWLYSYSKALCLWLLKIDSGTSLANTTLDNDIVSIYCALLGHQWKAKSQVYLCAGWEHLILEM